MAIVDHVNLPVSDLERSRQFYEAVLEPLGYKFLMQDGRAMGFGITNWNFGIVEKSVPPPTAIRVCGLTITQATTLPSFEIRMDITLRPSSVVASLPPNPSLQPTCYGWLRQPPQAAELKR